MFTQLYGFETVTTRYFNVFGPRQDPGSPYSGVISLFSTALLDGRQPTIYGDGEQTRDFTYVANVVDGVLRACEAPKAAGEVINVATGGRISLNELLRVMNGIWARASSRSTRSRVPATSAIRRPTSRRRRRLLGYEPTRRARGRLAAHAGLVPHGKRDRGRAQALGLYPTCLNPRISRITRMGTGPRRPATGREAAGMGEKPTVRNTSHLHIGLVFAPSVSHPTRLRRAAGRQSDDERDCSRPHRFRAISVIRG